MYSVNAPIPRIIWVKMTAALYMLVPLGLQRFLSNHDVWLGGGNHEATLIRLFLDRVLGNVSIIEAQFCASVHMCVYGCVHMCVGVQKFLRRRELV